MKAQKGYALVEVLVALAVISIVAAGFISALQNSIQASTLADRKDTARSLAQSQMEYIKKQPFAVSYAPDTISSDYAGYSANITAANAAERDSSIQKVTISIYFGGKVVFSLDNYKARR